MRMLFTLRNKWLIAQRFKVISFTIFLLLNKCLHFIIKLSFNLLIEFLGFDQVWLLQTWVLRPLNWSSNLTYRSYLYWFIISLLKILNNFILIIEEFWGLIWCRVFHQTCFALLIKFGCLLTIWASSHLKAGEFGVEPHEAKFCGVLRSKSGSSTWLSSHFRFIVFFFICFLSI